VGLACDEGGELGALLARLDDREPQSSVVGGVPRHVAKCCERQRRASFTARDRRQVLDQCRADAAPGVGWGDAHLLNVRAVVKRRAEEIGNWRVVIVHGDPRASGGPEDLELFDWQGLVYSYARHPDCRERASGVSLDRAQKFKLIPARRANGCHGSEYTRRRTHRQALILGARLAVANYESATHHLPGGVAAQRDKQ
jgi:hypothetical protein